MTKKVFILILSLLVFPVSTFAFSDVSENHKYYDAITFMNSNKIMQGYSDGSFLPEKILNRAEAIKIIVEAIYPKSKIEEHNNDNCFTDIKPGKWYTGDICFAKEKNIISGYPDNSFKPEQELTFVEIIKITMEAFNFDKAEDEIWFKPYIDVASQKNLIPHDITTFDQKFTRGQMAELTTRTIKSKQTNNEFPTLLEYLDKLSIQPVTYLSIKNHINIEEQIDFNWELLSLINAHRTDNNKEKLTINTDMSLAALYHSKTMSDEGKLSHTDAEGLTHLDRCELYNQTCYAENVAVHSTPTAKHFFDMWKESESHNENMLGNYTEIGIGLSGNYITNVFK